MSDTVVNLFGGSPINQPSKGTIEELEALLARAKRGELRGVTYATVGRTGGISTGWYGEVDAHTLLISGVALLQYRMCADEAAALKPVGGDGEDGA
jgi:hypothetical protein